MNTYTDVTLYAFLLGEEFLVNFDLSLAESFRYGLFFFGEQEGVTEGV